MHAVQMLSASRRKARAVTRHGQIIIRIAGVRPEIRSLRSCPDPQAMVQPSVPCPVFSHRFLYGVRPTTGVPSGVIGRRPVQKVACST